MADTHTYIDIDMKSFYASAECVARGMDPLRTNLLVADSRRPRLFEAKQAIRKYEQAHHTTVSYITAVPRMAMYEEVSAQIYGIYLKYVSPEDVHVYSIDGLRIILCSDCSISILEPRMSKRKPFL